MLYNNNYVTKEKEMKSRKFYPLAAAIVVFEIIIIGFLGLGIYVLINYLVNGVPEGEDFYMLVTILAIPLLIYFCIMPIGNIYFKQDYIRVHGDRRFLWKIQYPVKIYYDQIKKVDFIFSNTNSKCEEVKTVVTLPYIEVTYKDWSRKRIWVKKYTARQINKMLIEIEKRSGVKSERNTKNYTFTKRLKN